MNQQSIYKSPDGKAKILALYDDFLNKPRCSIRRPYGRYPLGGTHVLVFGPEHAQPVVITQGGNSINPQGLRSLLPILQENCYRIYTSDTIGIRARALRLACRQKMTTMGSGWRMFWTGWGWTGQPLRTKHDSTTQTFSQGNQEKKHENANRWFK